MSDLIKRSDVWNITAILHSEFITIEQEQILERIDEMIDGLPTADRPQGEWEIFAQGWHSIRRCSNCKWTQTYSDSKYMGYEYNYCPHCGARMKGADDE